MFVQIIEGKTDDPEGFRQVLEQWGEKVRPGAIGFLGATTAIAPDGSVVTMARFESEEKAMRNSARPEQTAMNEDLMKHASGEPTFHNCTEVDVFGAGGSNDAGFVQFMIGTATDKAKAKSMDEVVAPILERLRPDVIGGVVAWEGDWWCQAIYFTSEAAAREGETKFETLTGDDRANFEAMMAAYGEPRFVDGPNPLLM